jgi:hypothetical protein
MAGRRSISTAAPATIDVTQRVRFVCEDLALRLPELAHVDMSRVALRLCQTRRAGPHGVQATMTPLRFRDGADTILRRGAAYRIHPIPADLSGRPYLYLLSLYVPRFLDLSAEEKPAVIVHELWHASQAFDGDLRRFGPGRSRFHDKGCEAYHAEMQKLARRWLALNPPRELTDWMSGDFSVLRRRFGRVVGLRLPTPRLVRADRVPRDGSTAA